MTASNNSMQLEGKTILLGITGGIAAYKSCNIVRLLQKRGARVKVVMSEHATEFVGPLTFRALTNEPVAVGLFDDPSDPIHHISLAQEPDLVVVAPATANIIAKMANGIADDLISHHAACDAATHRDRTRYEQRHVEGAGDAGQPWPRARAWCPCGGTRQRLPCLRRRGHGTHERARGHRRGHLRGAEPRPRNTLRASES